MTTSTKSIICNNFLIFYPRVMNDVRMKILRTHLSLYDDKLKQHFDSNSLSPNLSKC
jgi:hypothetical protein